MLFMYIIHLQDINGDSNDADSSFEGEPPNKMSRKGTVEFVCSVAE